MCDCHAGCTAPRCALLANGEVCERDGDCQSEHCDQNVCCSDGTCCTETAMCPGGGSLGAVCEDSQTCQGTRGEVTCGEDYSCGTVHGVSDDSACDSNIQAGVCGRYRVFCNGEAMQGRRRECPTSCASYEACVVGSLCVQERCRAEDGQGCTVDEDCVSNYCGGGICCAAGDCCQVDEDCPGSYSRPAVCDSPATCQGTRQVAICSADFQCRSETVDNDSACGSTVLANSCGDARDQLCTGEDDQPMAACPETCSNDEGCDGDAHCGANDQCQPDLSDGSTCARDAVCQGDRCVNGHCCDQGDCCSTADDCPEDRYVRRSCPDVQRCDGIRVDAVCDANFRCAFGETAVPDDSDCEGSRALSCGDFRDAFCTAAVDQTPSCLVTCTGSDDCDSGFGCNDGDCQPF